MASGFRSLLYWTAVPHAVSTPTAGFTSLLGIIGAGVSGAVIVTPPSPVSRGGIWPEHDRRAAWHKAEQARVALRQSVDDLLEGRKRNIRASVEQVHEQVAELVSELDKTPEFPDVYDLVRNLSASLDRLIHQRTIRAGELRAAIELARRIALDLADDDDALIAIFAAI